jgi:hypothetical protein
MKDKQGGTRPEQGSWNSSWNRVGIPPCQQLIIWLEVFEIAWWAHKDSNLGPAD